MIAELFYPKELKDVIGSNFADSLRCGDGDDWLFGNEARPVNTTKGCFA
ncbi:MAG: hypothetical protein KDI13_02375 [Alphaproteobacteria bacterium]|nr:hypothetical protein [Alphaproteobacteria bacterium]